MEIHHTKTKLLVLLSIFYLLLSSFTILPITASQNQSSELIFISMNFQLKNITNNDCKNAFVYSYNITSPNNSTYTSYALLCPVQLTPYENPNAS